MLRRQGYTVVSARGADEAIEAMGRHAIDLILMDIDLGKGQIDGTELAQRIQRRWSQPIVFLTAHAEQAMVERVKGITRYGYVLKDSGEFVLLESIAMAFELYDAHQRAKDRRQRYELAIAGGNLGTWDWDVASDTIEVNDRWCEMIGYEKAEIAPHLDSWFDRVHPEDWPQVERTLKAHLHGDTDSYETEFRMRHRDGRWVWILDRGLVMKRGADGRPVRACGTHTDITERKISEQHLAGERDRLGSILSTVDIGLVVHRPDYRVEWVNRKMRELFPDREPVGELCYDVFEGRDSPCGKCAVRECFRLGEVTTAVCYNNLRDRWLSSIVQPMWDSGETPTLVLEAVMDVSEQKATEQALRESQESLARSVEQQRMLLRELNHRVKNNLSLVTSLIDLKDAAIGDSVDLSDIRNQVNAIRWVHEQLQDAADVRKISARPYLDRIARASLGVAGGAEVAVEVRVEEISLETRTAVSVGLIVSELATNAAKHGFRDCATKRFVLELAQETESDEYLLAVSNTGAPFPDHVDIEEPPTLGLRVVNALIAQIGGTLELQRNPTPRFTIRFPVA